MVKNLYPSKVAGHKGWWRFPSASENIQYKHQVPGFPGFTSPFFIDSSMYNVNFKYEIYESGASQKGFAKFLTGENTLKDAIKKVGSLEKKWKKRAK